MNKIRAKMTVNSVVNDGHNEAVTMCAVSDGSEENKSFATATPSASVSISINNPAAQGFLVKGKNFYVDFTPAP